MRARLSCLGMCWGLVVVACSPNPDVVTPPDAGSHIDVDATTPDVNIGCDPLTDPCHPIERVPSACAIEGTPPGGLPQLEVESTALPSTDVVAAAEGILALDDGRLITNGGEALLTVPAPALDFAAVPGEAGRFVVSYRSGSDLVIVDADATQQTELWRVRYATNTTGGAVGFDDDGFLFIGFGDDDEDLAAQDPLTLYGSVVRVRLGAIGAGYTVPGDNPFDATRGAPEVYAYGVHDPQSFDFGADRLWMTDRGGNFDEVNTIKPGENYGWPLVDGTRCAPSVVCSPGQFAGPTANYPRGTDTCGVIGGAAYPTDGSIEELAGAFLYADGCDGLIRAVRVSATGRVERDVVASHDATLVDVAGPLQFVAATSGLTLTIADTARWDAFPGSLAATGCFESNDGVWQAAPGLIPYFIRSPLWTDGASKRRWLFVPQSAALTVDDTGHLEFPTGSLIFKEFGFEFDDGHRPVEMRVMRRNTSTWSFFTYRFEDGLDANVLDGKQTAEFDVLLDAESTRVTYLFPDSASCRSCHSSSREVLGPRVDQLAGPRDYGDMVDDQLAQLAELGLLSPMQVAPLPDPADETASLNDRARSYLDANCGHCHRPGGWVPPDLTLDLQYATPLEQTQTCGTRMQYPNPFVPGDYRIVGGSPEESVLFQRMLTRGLGQMPLLATSIIDKQAEALIADWIRTLDCDLQP